MILFKAENLVAPAPWNIHVAEEVTSTNDTLLQTSLPHGTVLLARRQIAGKGSRNRSFFSPDGGLYLSVRLEGLSATSLPTLTPMAAVAVLRALRPHTKKDLAIKWVNDLYLEGRKVCGILTENRFEGTTCHTVVGVGINLVPPKEGFPPDLRHPAACLLESPQPQVAEEIINTFLKEFHALLAGAEFWKEYKENCCTLGKNVTLCRGDETVHGKAIDVLPDGSLRLRTAKGTERDFSSGEVTSQT